MRVIALLVLLVTFALVQPLTAQTAASCAPAGNIQFVCGQEAPEDLLHLPGSDWVIASSMAGNGGIRLISVRGKTSTLLYPSSSAKEQLDRKTYDTCPGAPEPDDKAKFTTHGLAMRAVRNSIYTLYAVHHGKRESIEVFQVDARSKTPVLTWIGCAIAPDPIGLNSVVPLPGGGFVATNFLERGANASAARTKMMAGENNGELWEWHTGKGWRKVPGSEAAGANGVEVSKDGKWLYVAAWGSQSFVTAVAQSNSCKAGYGSIRFSRRQHPICSGWLHFGSGPGTTDDKRGEGRSRNTEDNRAHQSAEYRILRIGHRGNPDRQ